MDGATKGSPPRARISFSISADRRLSRDRTRSPSNCIAGRYLALLVARRGRGQRFRAAAMAGETGDMYFAVGELRVDLAHHLDHQARGHFLLLHVRRSVVGDVAEVAAAFVGQTERGYECAHVVHVVL